MKRGFTLTELLVTITVGMLVVTGAMYFYGYVAENFLTVKQIGFDYQANETFASKYRELRDKYPTIVSATGAVASDGTGFQAVLFANSGGTEGCFLGVFDRSAQAVAVAPSAPTYSDYVPFFSVLTGATLASASGSMGSYVAGLNADIANAQKSFVTFDGVALLRLKFSRVNGSSSVGKLDYFLTNYHESLQGKKADLSAGYDVSIIR